LLDLSRCQQTPDSGLIAALAKLIGAIQAANVLNEDLHSLSVDLKLLEDGESLLKKPVVDGNAGNVLGLVVVQPVDVVDHTSRSG
jgi:hypothetical protein